MERICKNCKHKDPEYLSCLNDILEQKEDNPYLGGAFQIPNEDFGCNLFEYKEIKLNFDTTCDLEEGCTSCGS